MSVVTIAALVIFAGLLLYLFGLQKKAATLSRQVLFGLVLGSLFGFALQVVLGEGHPAIEETLAWVGIVGNGYVGLLKRVITPLELETMIS
ncbi:L-cystine transporter, partial [Vibrio cholerae]|nr:L-cystine transporter [Vibrio cholerae]